MSLSKLACVSDDCKSALVPSAKSFLRAIVDEYQRARNEQLVDIDAKEFSAKLSECAARKLETSYKLPLPRAYASVSRENVVSLCRTLVFACAKHDGFEEALFTVLRYLCVLCRLSEIVSADVSMA